MYNVGITTEAAVSHDDILFCTDNAVSVSIIVNQSAGSDGVVKAGTPLDGSLEDRTTAFTKAESTTAQGILLHDVDVSKGDNNATLLINGFVNLDRIDETTAALITQDVKTALKGNITFLKDN